MIQKQKLLFKYVENNANRKERKTIFRKSKQDENFCIIGFQSRLNKKNSHVVNIISQFGIDVSYLNDNVQIKFNTYVLIYICKYTKFYVS